MMQNTALASNTEGHDMPTEAAPGMVVIDTRFGRFEFDPDQAIEFPRGMMGFPNLKSFGLTGLPDPRLQQFMLLQSLENAEVSFLVLPVEPDDGIIARADLERAREELGIDAQDVATVLIVSIRNVGGKAQVSVNLRAPVMLDARRRNGRQHVLSNGNYPVRHVLSSGAAG